MKVCMYIHKLNINYTIYVTTIYILYIYYITYITFYSTHMHAISNYIFTKEHEDCTYTHLCANIDNFALYL